MIRTCRKQAKQSDDPVKTALHNAYRGLGKVTWANQSLSFSLCVRPHPLNSPFSHSFVSSLLFVHLSLSIRSSLLMTSCHGNLTAIAMYKSYNWDRHMPHSIFSLHYIFILASFPPTSAPHTLPVCLSFCTIIWSLKPLEILIRYTTSESPLQASGINNFSCRHPTDSRGTKTCVYSYKIFSIFPLK